MILPFTKPEASRIRRAGAGSAEIVIFPGVRIEYHDEKPAPGGKGRTRRRRRKGNPKDVLSA
jgi:hypothetical protein